MTQENSIGKPLADSKWLENHHYAKLNERTAFAKRIAEYHPKKIVDLGCATGLWLELLNGILSDDCIFIGIDSDPKSLNVAKRRSKDWKRKTEYMLLDIEKDANLIPSADLTLAFNIFPYIEDLDSFLLKLSNRKPKGTLIVRQYDGASIRFGPMATETRQKIEADLRLSTQYSSKFRHYDLDRAFCALKKSNYNNMNYDFELFKRISPFDDAFFPYYYGMIEWTIQHISESSASFLNEWLHEKPEPKERYFLEVDLIAILS